MFFGRELGFTQIMIVTVIAMFFGQGNVWLFFLFSRFRVTYKGCFKDGGFPTPIILLISSPSYRLSLV